MGNKNLFWTKKEEIKDWDGVEALEKKLFPRRQTWEESKKWIFRGERLQADANNYLKTHLEKAFTRNAIRGKRKKRKTETELIRRFQRKAALYLEHEPDKDDILEWLAIMRHHGAHTRLLDWVYSFYIALYFALNENEKGVVWALNYSTINNPERIVKKICEKANGFRKFSVSLLYYLKKCDFLGIRQEGDKLIDLAIACYLIENPLLCVYPVNPFRLNKRLSVQQSLFLMPGDITKSFVENLTETFGGFEQTKTYLWKINITPNKEDRKKILEKLKDMNVSNEVLFPDLDGFARSVGESLAYPRLPGDA